MSGELVKLGAIERAIADVKTLGQRKDAHANLATIEEHYRQHGASTPEINAVARLRLLNGHYAGKWIRANVKRGGGSKCQNGTLIKGTPKQMPKDVSPRLARNWRMVGGSSLRVIESYIACCNDDGQDATLEGFKNYSQRGTMSSNEEWWNTPSDIIARVVKTMGAIDLDPCSDDADSPNVPAAQHFTEKEDGLEHEWHGRVYMNPPYGSTIGQWILALVLEFEEDRTTEAVALLPSRTDTAWFGVLAPYVRCFIRGRLKFGDAKNSAPFPSMAVYLGKRPSRFADSFNDLGLLYTLWDPSKTQKR